MPSCSCISLITQQWKRLKMPKKHVILSYASWNPSCHPYHCPKSITAMSPPYFPLDCPLLSPPSLSFTLVLAPLWPPPATPSPFQGPLGSCFLSPCSVHRVNGCSKTHQHAEVSSWWVSGTFRHPAAGDTSLGKEWPRCDAKRMPNSWLLWGVRG